jgi:hypothetical protein
MSIVTVVTEDKAMTIDGDSMNFDLGLDDNIWAIQWDGSKGHIEYNDGSPNTDITEFPELESLTAKHGQAKIDAEAKVVTDAIADEKKRVDAMTWEDKRREAYPSIEDVTVALAEKAEGDSTMWDAISKKRADVKKAHPKP